MIFQSEELTINSIIPPQGELQMKPFKFALFFASAFSISVLADTPNVILGKWRWHSEDCAKADFIFNEKSITHHTDADGTPIADSFQNVRYSVSHESVTVDFGKNHGFGGTQNKKQIFKIIDNNHVVMVRKKKGLNDLYRCN